MCGIVIGVNTKWGNDPLSTLSHRGPDFSNFIKKNNIFMGHTRLSILDLSKTGNQPMVSNDKNYIMVYNGEIYNHIEVREKLILKGYIFRGTSDSETLLNSWIEWGKNCLKLLNGIFAFGIYDIKRKKLYIARDRFGVKPQYFYHCGNTIAFSSEIKTFLNIKNFNSEIEPNALVNYLTFLWSPGEITMYKNIKKILPGTISELDLEKMSFKSSKFFLEPESNDYWDYTEKDWVKIIDEKLNQAVERQMLSDTPIGYFLSGGLDSSLLVAMARTQFPSKKIECFTIDQFRGSNQKGYSDDLPFAKKVSEFLDINLNVIYDRAMWVDFFDKMIWHLDEPQADLAPINVSKISKQAKLMGIKVLIGGAGGDDIFSGYRRHMAAIFNDKINLLPKPILSIISKTIHSFSSSNHIFRRMKKLTRDWDKGSNQQLMGYFNWLPNELTISKIFSNKVYNEVKNYDPYNYGLNILSSKTNSQLIDKLLMLEQKTFLIDHNLNYTDKLSMLHGVEARVPYLDNDLVELTTHIPQNFKIRKGISKYILKKVAEKYLPDDVIYRSKTGFGAPLDDLLESDFKFIIQKYLNEKKIKEDNIFNHKTISEILNKNKQGDVSYNYNILSLLSIQSWLKQFPWSIN